MKKLDFINQWNAIELMKLFEIEVTNRKTGEPDYVIFDISIQGRSFVAQHESLSLRQDRSKKIAFVRVPIDFDFSIDQNLENLFDACQNAILDSEYFQLS